MNQSLENFYSSLSTLQQQYLKVRTSQLEQSEGYIADLIDIYGREPDRSHPEVLSMHRDMMDKALHYLEEEVPKAEYAAGLSQLAELYRLDPRGGMDYLIKSLELLHKSLEIKEQIGDELAIAHTKVKISTCIMQSQNKALHFGNAEDAEKLLWEALAVYERENCLWGLIPSLLNLTELYCRKDPCEIEKLLARIDKCRLNPGFSIEENANLALMRSWLLNHLEQKPEENFLKELKFYLEVLPDNSPGRDLRKHLEQCIAFISSNHENFEEMKRYVEKNIETWDPEQEMEDIPIRDIIALKTHFPRLVSARQTIEMAQKVLMKALPVMLDARNNHRFAENAWIREGTLNTILHILLDENVPEEILLFLENYSCFHFKSNYHNMTFVGETREDKFAHAVSNLLGNYGNFFRQAQKECWKEELDGYNAISERLMFLVDKNDLEKLRKYNLSYRAHLQKLVNAEHSREEIMSEIAREQMLLNPTDAERRFCLLTVSDIEEITQKNPNRAFVYLQILANDYRLIGIGTGYNLSEKRTEFRISSSQPNFTEETCRNFVSGNLNRSSIYPKNADGNAVYFAEAIRDVITPWIEKGFSHITLIPFGTGTRRIPWENIPDQNGVRLIDLVEGISYCSSIVCYRKPIRRRAGNDKFFFAGNSVKNPHPWGNMAMQICGIKTGKYDKVSRDKLLAASKTATHIGLYCHGFENEYNFGAHSLSEIGTLLVFDDRTPETAENMAERRHKDYREVWSPDLDGIPLYGIHGVELWACSTANPKTTFPFEKYSIEIISMVDKFMCRGVSSVIAPIYPVYDFSTAIIACAFYLFLDSCGDEEAAFTRTRKWYFKKAVPKLVEVYQEIASKESDVKRSRYLVFQKFLQQELGLEVPDKESDVECDNLMGLGRNRTRRKSRDKMLPPFISTLGLAPRLDESENGEFDDKEQEVAAFHAALTDPHTWNFILWKGGTNGRL